MSEALDADNRAAISAALGLGNFSRFSGLGGGEVLRRALGLAHKLQRPARGEAILHQESGRHRAGAQQP